MRYYDLSPTERKQRKEEIKSLVLAAIPTGGNSVLEMLFSDDDTHTRKVTYLELSKIYSSNDAFRPEILSILNKYIAHSDEKVRQTVVYASGEIAAKDFAVVEHLIEKGLLDTHHSVRNASTGALKTAGNKNPAALVFCKKHIQSSEAEVRRLICHGLELRGRTHPQEIIHLLQELQHDTNKRVIDMLIHVLGQISYKKGCFYFVFEQVKKWGNEEILSRYKDEVIEVHERYAKFSDLSVDAVRDILLQL